MSALVEVKGLKKYFSTPGGMLHAVDNINIAFEEGRTMGIVGESGCGKSTFARTLVHLHEPTKGSILLRGQDVTYPSKRELPKLREEMQLIFQDPYMTLNPRYTVEETLKEPLVLSGKYEKASLDQQIRKLMDMVGIGRALAMNPKFIACDEPVSALDVSIQAQIINLLMDLQEVLPSHFVSCCRVREVNPELDRKAVS